MVRWAVVFLVIALVAALFGFTDIAAASAGIAKILFGIFLLVAAALVIAAAGVFVARGQLMQVRAAS